MYWCIFSTDEYYFLSVLEHVILHFLFSLLIMELFSIDTGKSKENMLHDKYK